MEVGQVTQIQEDQGLLHGGSAGPEDTFGFKQAMMVENSNPA